MALGRDIRRRARGAIAPALVIGLGLYLAYHALNGERGWIARQTLDQEIAARQVSLEAAEGERAALENRVRRLRRGSLDSDLLDERARGPRLWAQR